MTEDVGSSKDTNEPDLEIKAPGNKPPVHHPEEQKNLDSWSKRRRVIYLTMIFCVLVICYCLYKGGNDRVTETATMSAFGLLATVAVGYIFGATWDDGNKSRASSGRDRGRI